MHTIDPAVRPSLRADRTPPRPHLSAALGPRSARGGARPPAPVLDVVVPVHNEVATVRSSVERLHAHLSGGFPFRWRITIVDNASSDGTWERVIESVAELDGVAGLRLDTKGRGLALRTAWERSDAAVLAYTDVDLSTGLDALLPLIAPLVSGHSDLAIGSRLSPGSRVARGPRRELISRSYNRLLRTVFATKVHDAQCGFKAIRADVARRLLPEVDDDGWFFDTELLLLAEHNGLRIHEVPVDWVDDPDSRVHVLSTAARDLAGSARMLRTFASGGGLVDLGSARREEVRGDLGGRLVSFTAIGGVSTAVSLGIFLVLRPHLGAVGANAAAVLATFVGNSWAHARYTLGRRQVRWGPAVATLGAGLGCSTVALVLAETTGAPPFAEVAVVLSTWMATAIVRLVTLQRSDDKSSGRAADAGSDLR